MRRFALPTVALLYAGLIIYLSSHSQLPTPMPGFEGADKLAHALEYAGLGLLVTWTLGTFGCAQQRALVLGVVVSSLFGVTDELHQFFVPGRDCSVLDWVADSAGGTLGAAAWFFVSRRRSGSRPVEEA
ncbi:MAG: VanZ family protein [Myxococcaceae bacterium]